MDNSVKYLTITCLSFPLLAVYHSAAAVFRAAGRTKISMLISLGMNLMNIIGNAICIFGLKMDVAGVAIPTVIARLAAALAMMILLQQRSNGIRIRSLSDFFPDPEVIRKILSIGIPNSIESSLFNVGKILLQSLVSTLGTSSIAAYAVASNLVTYLYLPGNAIGTGLTTIVGQCYGAGEPEQAKIYTRKMILLNYAMLAVICGIMLPFRSFFVGLYHLSAPAARLAARLLLAHGIAMVIWPPAFDLPYYFRAVGRARFTMIVSISVMAVFRVGLAYLFIMVMHQGILWVWYAMFIDWIARLFIYASAFSRSGIPGQK